MSNLKVGVIGLGAMGKHHIRVWSQIEGADLVAVCDTNPQTMREVMKRHDPEKVSRYKTSSEMFYHEGIGAVSICVPTIYHCSEAVMALMYDAHVLLEKPITADLQQAENLCNLAKERNLVLSVGHIERYNPAAITARELLRDRDLGPIYEIHARRLGPNPERVRDVGVVIDLAVHDIDLITWIAGKPVTLLSSLLQHRNHGPMIEDGATITLATAEPNGILATITTNWLTTAKIRDLTIVCQKGTIVADLFHKKVSLWTRYDQVEEIVCHGIEPLQAEIQAFVDAVRCEPNPRGEIITAEEATATLACAISALS